MRLSGSANQRPEQVLAVGELEAVSQEFAGSVALAISGGGALSWFETTVLMSVDEMMEAVRDAQQTRYRRPGTRHT